MEERRISKVFRRYFVKKESESVCERESERGKEGQPDNQAIPVAPGSAIAKPLGR